MAHKSKDTKGSLRIAQSAMKKREATALGRHELHVCVREERG